ncbi:MAG: Gfo/Idh/MocA family oxidoreductase [Candidatus Omnitrophica bacterium]|nr:Gfo/Idh/MocA family oxidoreductase [Candidatus Omnitrophota bacterium]
MKDGADVSRREFLETGAKVVAAATTVTSVAAQSTAVKSLVPHTVLGANERILTGHIGLGGMGTDNLRFVLKRDDIQPIAVCDIYPTHKERAAELVKEKWAAPTLHHHFREILENKDIDAVVIATPDHWHAIPTIEACEAGKDVWCEKPLATTIEEGIHMVDAVRRNNRVFQGGTMQRSGDLFKETVELVKSGYLGKVARVETFIHDKNTRASGMGNPPDEDPPEGCDWEFHQGWTKHVPFNRNRWLHSFRYFLDYSGGKVTDWGAHLVDIAVWAMGEEKIPKSIAAYGGKYILTDNRTTPDTLEVIWEFDDYVLTFANRAYNGVPPYLSHYGIIFHGELGSLFVNREGYEVLPAPLTGEPTCKPIKRGDTPDVPPHFETYSDCTGTMNAPHWQNFADCVRSRERCICDVEVINNSSTLCHMGTCAYVAGGTLSWDPTKARFTGGDADVVRRANDFAYRPYHNGWKLS